MFMTQCFKIRPLSVLVGLALLWGGVSACKAKSDTPDTMSVSVLSHVQERVIKRRGFPDLFAVTFDRGLAQRRGIRRVDTWVYLGSTNQRVVFDDGYFVEQEDMAGDVAVPAKTDLKPTHFGPGLSAQDITTRYGQPDDQELTTIEGQNLAILHYAAQGNKPKKTFGFVDNALVAVTIGFSFGGQRTTL